MDGRNCLHDDVVRRLDEQEHHGGILLKLLKPGTILVVRTKNSVYRMEIIEGNSIFIEGGTRWPEPTLVRFNGSNWGTSMLWSGRIGYNMHMEIVTDRELIVTTPVWAARIESPDGWHYDMEWPSASCKACAIT